MKAGETVLIVDDDASVRNTVGSFFRISHPGVVIVHANHGAHAWEMINTDGRRFDVVISDVNMEPDMTGTQLSEKIREKHPNIHVILMSGKEAPKGHKAHAFLQKPFSRGDLLGVIKGLRLARKQ